MPVAEDDADRADVALRLVEADDRDHAARRRAPRTGSATSILRYFNVAGADPQLRTGQSTPGATHLIKVAVEAALGQRERIDVFGTDYPTPDGTCIRDYIHVSDLARAHLAALGYLRSGGESATLNCGYGRGYSVLRGDRRGEARRRPQLPGELRRRAGRAIRSSIVAAADRIRETLGWTPQFDDLDTIVAPRARLGTPAAWSDSGRHRSASAISA